MQVEVWEKLAANLVVFAGVHAERRLQWWRREGEVRLDGDIKGKEQYYAQAVHAVKSDVLEAVEEI